MVGIDFEMPSCCTSSSFVHCSFYDVCRYRETIRANFKPNDCPVVEAIPKAEVKKFLEEGTKNVGNNVLAIVREDYIHKADYEKRLKADLIAMLTELQLEIEELEKPRCHNASHADGCVSKWRVEGVIQQKIDKLKENKDG